MNKELAVYGHQSVAGEATIGGNVGIGTTAPTAKLEVSGSAIGQPALYSFVNGGVGDGFSSPPLRLRSSDLPANVFWDVYASDGAAAASPRFGISYTTGGSTENFRFVMNAGGQVGIQTVSPEFDLHVHGSAGKPGGGSWSVASDRRLKKNVHRLDRALDRLLRLRGVTFEYKDPVATNELPGMQTGMIAQEVEQVFPEWVDSGAGGYKNVTFRGFEALTVEALRELREEKDSGIWALEARVLALIERQQAQITALQAEIDSLRATSRGVR